MVAVCGRSSNQQPPDGLSLNKMTQILVLNPADRFSSQRAESWFDQPAEHLPTVATVARLASNIPSELKFK